MTLSRRTLLAGAASVAVGAVAAPCARHALAGSVVGVADGILASGAVDPTRLSPAVRLFESKRATVVLFGDSIVSGLGLRESSSRWSDRVQAMLRRDSQTALMTIDNRAVPGQAIVSERPTFDTETRREVFAGGRLVDHAFATFPEGTPRERTPRVVVIVPSINEIIVSQQPTPADRAALALSGLHVVRDHLLRLGTQHVVIPPMVLPTQRFDDTTPRDVIDEVTVFNRAALASGTVSAVDYGIGRPDLYGSEDRFFDEGYDRHNDGLHPGPLGHSAIAHAMFAVLRSLAVRW